MLYITATKHLGLTNSYLRLRSVLANDIEHFALSWIAT